MKNVLELLERSAQKHPNKIAFSDMQTAICYLDFMRQCQSVGTALSAKGYYKRVIAVYMDQSVCSLVSALGIVYAGNSYVIIDSKMPAERIRCILDTVHPAAILCSAETLDKVSETGFDGETIVTNSLTETPIDEQRLSNIRKKQIDSDPLYILFTSGSTGMPKGTVIHHKNVLSYSAWFCEAFSLDEHTVFGNQTPFYFSMSVSDVYGTLRSGATLHIIPKKLFSFPVKLLEYLNEKTVNTLYWVPSALCIVADWKALDFMPVPTLQRVLFAGEVMPSRQLNYWRSKLPEAVFANLFGPTETTDICCYYVVNRPIDDAQSVPIGVSCNNCECLIVGEKGLITVEGEMGELYVRGSFVAPGYFGNPEKTSSAFVQNPLHNDYPEFVYRTGDLVRLNSYGEMEYVCRKDFQIKHMGYRIELGEIESAANATEGIKLAVVIYDKEKDDIVLIYNGKKMDSTILTAALAKRLPNYMMPTRIIRIREMPYNANGKIDRAFLSGHYNEL